jgi:hypothetical protein
MSLWEGKLMKCAAGFLWFIAMLPGTSAAQSLAAEMDRLKVSVAVVVPIGSIDDYPLWSPDGDFLIVNLAPRGWWKLAMSQVVLSEAKYRERPIAVAAKGSSFAAAGADEVKRAKDSTRMEKTELSLNDGRQMVWEANGSFGAKLTMRTPQGAPEPIWETDMNVCGYLVPSPDRSMVASYCENVGAIVVRLK